MHSADNSNIRRSGSKRSDLHEARPLLQAILLGIVLASALVAAAAFAAPEPAGSGNVPPATGQSLQSSANR
jgi:hypothetical protein